MSVERVTRLVEMLIARDAVLTGSKPTLISVEPFDQQTHNMWIEAQNVSSKSALTVEYSFTQMEISETYAFGDSNQYASNGLFTAYTSDKAYVFTNIRLGFAHGYVFDTTSHP